MTDKTADPEIVHIEDATEGDLRAMLGDELFDRLAEEGRRAVATGLSAHAAGASSAAEYRRMVKG